MKCPVCKGWGFLILCDGGPINHVDCTECKNSGKVSFKQWIIYQMRDKEVK